MEKVNLDGLEVSKLCLGGGKMVDLSLNRGVGLVSGAFMRGINLFDAHHRYGNCEAILRQIPNVHKMTKVSAYHERDIWVNIKNSEALLENIDILWVSDLDDEGLYAIGKRMYKELVKQGRYKRIGVTSENPKLALRFAEEHPECKYFMVPIFPKCVITVAEVRKLQEQGFVFAIKPFDDGRCFPTFSIVGCLEVVKEYNPEVVVFGTKNPDHLMEIINIWNRKSIEEIYDNGYEAHIAELKLFKLDEGKKHFKVMAGKYKRFLEEGTLCDVGCGTGVMVYGYQQLGFDAHGCDISEWAVRNAVTKGITKAPVQKLPYDDRRFMNVTAFDVLEHVPVDELNKALKECERVTEKAFIVRIPYDEQWGAEFAHKRAEVTMEHMIQMPFDWWSKRLRKVFKDDTWTEQIERIKDTNWKIFKYKRR